MNEIGDFHKIHSESETSGSFHGRGGKLSRIFFFMNDQASTESSGTASNRSKIVNVLDRIAEDDKGKLSERGSFVISIKRMRGSKGNSLMGLMLKFRGNSGLDRDSL